jgi:hypothetical protein
MNTFLTELADKLADKWVSLVIAPGLLFLTACVGGGDFLGQSHWGGWTRLYSRISNLSTSKPLHSAVVLGILVVAVLAGAAAAGLAARFLGDAINRMWLGRWPRFFDFAANALTNSRRGRWIKADDAHRTAMVTAAEMRVERMQGLEVQGDMPDLAAFRAKRNAIGLERPQRPTWIGDRLLAVDTRVFRFYDLDLSFAWSRLWMTMTDTDRSDLTAAQGAFTAASRLVGWGILYLVLGLWWWPSAIIGVCVVLGGWKRGRESASSCADLIEAAVDVHVRALATSLGVGEDGRLTLPAGHTITQTVRKGA